MVRQPYSVAVLSTGGRLHPNPYGRDLGRGYRVRTLPLGRDRWGKNSTKGGYILSFLRKERLGEKGGTFFNGKEGRVGFRKNYYDVSNQRYSFILPRRIYPCEGNRAFALRQSAQF